MCVGGWGGGRTPITLENQTAILLMNAGIDPHWKIYIAVGFLLNTHTEEAAIENVNNIDDRRSKIVRNRVFDCHLSPDWRQMAIFNTVSSFFDPRSSIAKSDFDCRLSGVILVHTPYPPEKITSYPASIQCW